MVMNESYWSMSIFSLNILIGISKSDPHIIIGSLTFWSLEPISFSWVLLVKLVFDLLKLSRSDVKSLSFVSPSSHLYLVINCCCIIGSLLCSILLLHYRIELLVQIFDIKLNCVFMGVDVVMLDNFVSVH